MGRKAGRPKGKAAMGPEELEKLSRLYLRGFSLTNLAKIFGVSDTTISHHLDQFRVRWRDSQKGLLEEELAKVRELERVAWECFELSKEPEIRRVVKRTTNAKLKNELKRKGADAELVEQSITRTTRIGSTAYLQIIQWCIEYRAKVMGYFRDQGSEMGDLAPKVVFVEIEDREEVEQFTTMERLQAQMDSRN